MNIKYHGWLVPINFDGLCAAVCILGLYSQTNATKTLFLIHKILSFMTVHTSVPIVGQNRFQN